MKRTTGDDEAAGTVRLGRHGYAARRAGGGGLRGGGASLNRPSAFGAGVRAGVGPAVSALAAVSPIPGGTTIRPPTERPQPRRARE